MSKDTIYRQDAIDALKSLEESVPTAQHLSAIFDCEDVIKGIPSAQPEIIRCKDCKHYGRADKRRFYRGMDCLNKHIDTIVPDRDFCSKAERRTDD